MPAKWKPYIPLILFMPFIAAVAAYAMTGIVSDTGSRQLFADDAIPDAAITTGFLSDYQIPAVVPRISESSSLPVPLHPLPTPKPNDLDIDELNRRLIAEGLEPIIIEEEPPPPEATPAYIPVPEPVIEEPPPPLEPEPLENPEPVLNPPTEPDKPLPAPVVSNPLEEATQTPPSKPSVVFTEASYKSNPEPPYPKAAERKGLEGVVLLRVHVGTDGHPVAVNLLNSSGHSILDKAAVHAVRNAWRFNPATTNGQPVEAWVEVPIIFTLD